MTLMQRVRVYHAALAVLAVLAFLSGDFGLVHAWLGYAVAAIIVLRLMWAAVNPRQLGLNRFYPEFDGLRFDNAVRHPGVSKLLILCVALSLIGATLTGVAMDRGRAIGVADAGQGGALIAAARADDDRHEGSDGRGGDEFFEEIHESLSNLFIMFVVLHAGYLLLFKRPLALYMLYRDRNRRKA